VTGLTAAMQRIKRIATTILGGSVLALGIAMLLLPGPAFLVIPAGLAILAIEFAWARRWLRSARALLPQPYKRDSAVTKKLTMKSLWRSAGFLLRQVRRTLLPQRRNT